MCWIRIQFCVLDPYPIVCTGSGSNCVYWIRIQLCVLDPDPIVFTGSGSNCVYWTRIQLCVLDPYPIVCTGSGSNSVYRIRNFGCNAVCPVYRQGTKSNKTIFDSGSDVDNLLGIVRHRDTGVHQYRVK